MSALKDVVGAIEEPRGSLSKAEFGRKLHNLITERGWNQSELARRCGLGRDAISTYIRGRSFPEPKNLKLIADTLGMDASELLPNSLESQITKDEAPTFEIKQSAAHPGKVWLRVNQAVSFKQAGEIMEILQRKDD